MAQGIWIGSEYGPNDFLLQLSGPITWLLLLIVIACVDSLINLPQGSRHRKATSARSDAEQKHASTAGGGATQAPIWLQVSSFLLPLALYSHSNPGTVGMVDAGSMSLAAWLPGVAHPPGFPFIIFLGHFSIKAAASAGISLSPAYILNLTSGVGAALTIHLIWR